MMIGVAKKNKKCILFSLFSRSLCLAIGLVTHLNWLFQGRDFCAVPKFGFFLKYFLYLFNFLISTYEYDMEFFIPDYCDRVIIFNC
jgi:hypothetical protein